MTDFHDELRDALSRKASEAPRPGGMPEGVLRRAKRRRAANATLAGGLAVALAFGGFIGVRAAMDAAAPMREDIPAQQPTQEPTAAPSPSQEPTAEPSPEPTEEYTGLRCERTEGGSDEVFPDFVDVSYGADTDLEGGHASVTFHFEPMAGQTEAPWHIIDFTDQLVTDGEGAPVDVEGEAFVAVTFMARGVDLSGEEFVEIYTGPKEIAGKDVIAEMRHIGDFEGMVSWGIGLRERTCYAVDAGPDHLTITFVR